MCCSLFGGPPYTATLLGIYEFSQLFSTSHSFLGV